MKLDEKAMIVVLNIRAWTARKYDRKISKEVEDIHKSKDAGRYNKLLIAKISTAKIQKIASEARGFHYDNTLPWLDNGGRLLPSDNYFDYVGAIRKFKDQYEDEVDRFIGIYPKLMEEAQYRLANMFNAADYPSVCDVEKKYSFGMQIFPVPVSDDFRVGLNDDDIAGIKEKIDEQVMGSMKLAMGDLWSRLFGVVQCMSERLSEKDNKFKNSLVTNISELCKILPKLNITNDPGLSASVLEIESKLTAHDPQTLRDDGAIRRDVAIEAQRILNKMRSFVT